MGMSLVEIMVVIVIIGLISSAVGFAAFEAGQEAKVSLTQTSAKALLELAEMCKMAGKCDACPGLQQVQDSGMVRKGTAMQDAWGTDFTFDCGEAELNVRSFGPDLEDGTEDDIVAWQ